jgi:MraZ protein
MWVRYCLRFRIIVALPKELYIIPIQWGEIPLFPTIYHELRMPLFTGRFEYTVDDKGRLSIPARMREQLEKEGQDTAFIVTSIHPDYLSAYAPNEFQELIASIRESTDPNSRELLRRLASEAETCPLDKQGRLMLPASLRQLAALTRDVVVLGVAKRIEVWDRTRYAAHRAGTAENGARLLSGLKAPSDLV